MDKKEVDEIIAYLPRGATEFSYAKDQYATELLARIVGHGKDISEIKKSIYRRFLNKDAVKAGLAKAGSGRISAGDLSCDTASNGREFVLTLARWGGVHGDYQTSRRGFNLVLQLNFSEEHDARYKQLVNPRDDALFNYRGHPVLQKGQREIFHETLAWSRMDVDFDTGTALIEEIQNDWIRNAKSAYMARMRFRHKESGRYWARQMKCCRISFGHYVEDELKPYESLWAEAMLMATIRFLFDELGIRTIYYHSFETGAAVKNIFSQPPRSLYMDLPKRFCFEKTGFAPGFILSDDSLRQIRTVKRPYWYRLTM